MKMKIIISTIIAFYIGSLLSPPDVVTILFNGIIAAFICCLTLLILARCKFVKSSPNSMHTLVCILVCMVSFLSVQWIGLLCNKIAGDVNLPTNVSTANSFHIGNLRIQYLSDRRGIFSKETECVVCSVDSPKTYGYDGSTIVFTFSDNNSVEVNIKNDETIWIDEQHRVKFLGPVLNKEDVLLLCDHRHDEEFKVSSPEELLTIVNKLKAEHVDSRDPQKDAVPNNVKLSGE